MTSVNAFVVGVHVAEEVLCSLRLHDEIVTAWQLLARYRRCVFSPLEVVVASPRAKIQNYGLWFLSSAFVTL